MLYYANIVRIFYFLGVDRYEESPCPVTGEYTGVLPDEHTLCAKLYSDCNNPEIMFYTVAACSNKSQVYEGNKRQKSW